MLYSLYNDVSNKMTTMAGLNFFKIDMTNLSNEIKQLQMRCYKLPRSMRQF